MKRIIFALAITIGLINELKAQHWALPSSEWTIRVIPSFSSSYSITYKVAQADTLILGKVCKKIYPTTTAMQPLYSYEENDSVFFYQSGQFYPTLFFSATIGDIVSFPVFQVDGNYCGNEITIPHINCIIDSITSINIGGNTINRFFFSPVGSQNYVYSYVESENYYTEYLGANNLFPYFVCENITDLDGYVLCSYNDSTLVSPYTATLFCETSSINENTLELASINPNPTSNFLTIEAGTNEIMDVEIFDLSGRKVLATRVTDKQVIDVRKLSSTVYQLRLTDSFGNSGVKLFAKE